MATNIYVKYQRVQFGFFRNAARRIRGVSLPQRDDEFIIFFPKPSTKLMRYQHSQPILPSCHPRAIKYRALNIIRTNHIGQSLLASSS
jgi:hypothetical protein